MVNSWEEVSIVPIYRVIVYLSRNDSNPCTYATFSRPPYIVANVMANGLLMYV